MLRSDLCDYSDAYTVVKGIINVEDPNNNAYDKKLAFKNDAPFISCISNINDTLIDNVEDFDIVMRMYNLIGHSKNCSKTTGSLWNYYRDEPNSGAVGDINYSISGSKYFDYKTSITGRLEDNNTEKEVEIVVPLKHLSNFWKTLDIQLTLTLTWSKNYVITSKVTRDADPDANPAAAAVDNPTNATFKITDTQLYDPAVTLSTEDDNKL